jgi:hypothetical protein
MKDNVVVPMGGRHKSASSLLAEIMNDPTLAKVVVFTIDHDGDGLVAHYEMTRAELTFAAARIQRFAFEG